MNAVTANTRQHYINNTGITLLLNATIADTYVYDHEGRKIQTFEQINGGTNVLLSQLVYNEVSPGYRTCFLRYCRRPRLWYVCKVARKQVTSVHGKRK